MKLFKIHAFLLLVIMLFFPKQISAVSGYPYPIEVKQPNGEKITIQTHGDEFFHYATTTEGYVVDVDNNGYFTFAEINNEGYILPGKVRVSENTLKNSNNSFLKANSSEFIQKVKQPALSRRAGMVKDITALRSNNALRSAKNITAENTKALVILAEFTDEIFSVSNPQQTFTNMLNQLGYSMNEATGSVRDYFINSSDDAYKPEFIVYGPVTLPHNMAFYGENDKDGNDKNPGQMIIDACKAAKSKYSNSLNFADFPLYKDGSLDNVSVIYAGYNEAENYKTLPNTIWPHQYYLQGWKIPVSQRKIDGVTINSYMCTSELKGGKPAKNMAGIGTFIHEYGHALGLPDLYDANDSVDGIVVTAPSDWDVMASGNYLNNGNTPPSYCAVERWMLDWMNLYIISGKGSLTIPPITSSDAMKTLVVETPTKYEFFTLEVRKNEGWDLLLPGEGMLIYHIDMSNSIEQTTDYDNMTMRNLWEYNTPNIVGNHPGMKLMTANREVMTLNSNNSYSYKNYKGHLFPGYNNVTSISDDTNPGFRSWNNEKSNVSISNIVRNANGSISFTYSNLGGSDIKEYNINSPFAFNSDNTIYFKNISGNTQVNIYDIKGNCYVSKKINEPDSQEIAIPGIYIVKLQTNKDVFTYKIIIR